MALVLTLIAVPLSRLRPRQGRYARVGFAIVVYFVYSNLLSAAKVWLEKGELPPLIGVWWVHLLVAGARRRTWCSASRAGMNTLDRYLYRTVLVYALHGDGACCSRWARCSCSSASRATSASATTPRRDAFMFTLLNLPQQAFELLPIGAMIGALMGLGNLAAGSELVVTRASGVSVWRIAWPVGLAGLTLALRMYGIGEYVAPPMAQFAKREKTTREAGGRQLRRLERRLGQGRQSASCACRPAKSTRRSAACRCSSWTAPRASSRCSAPTRISVADPGPLAAARRGHHALRRTITSRAKSCTR